jgi:hypothetical protein
MRRGPLFPFLVADGPAPLSLRSSTSSTGLQPFDRHSLPNAGQTNRAGAAGTVRWSIPS